MPTMGGGGGDMVAWRLKRYFEREHPRSTVLLARQRFALRVHLVDVMAVEVTREEMLGLTSIFAGFDDTACERLCRSAKTLSYRFWFRRSGYADEHGYYDFPPRCRTMPYWTQGSSAGWISDLSVWKADWIRAPWDAPFCEISNELLRALYATTRPLHPLSTRRDRVLMTPVEMDKWVAWFAYFEPFTGPDPDIEDSEGAPVPLPPACTPELMAEVSRCLLGRPQRAAPTLEHVAAVLRCMDVLSMDRGLMRAVYRRHLCAQQDLHATCPAAWAAWAREHPFSRSWAAAQEADEDNLVRITSEVSDDVRYIELNGSRGPMWLFAALPACGLPHGTAVLRPDPCAAVLSQLPASLLGLLKKFPRMLYLAGGSVLGMLSEHVNRGSDWDLFIIGQDGQTAQVILDEVVRAGGGLVVSKTRRAVTVHFGNFVTVQVVLKLYPSLARLFQTFDLDPSKVCVFWDQVQDRIEIWATASWLVSMRHMTVWFDVTRAWGRSSMVRLLKYAAKGFDVFLPGLRREVFNRSPQRGGRQQAGDGSLLALFAAESSAVTTRLKAASYMSSAISAKKVMISRYKPEEAADAARTFYSGSHNPEDDMDSDTSSSYATPQGGGGGGGTPASSALNHLRWARRRFLSAVQTLFLPGPPEPGGAQVRDAFVKDEKPPSAAHMFASAPEDNGEDSLYDVNLMISLIDSEIDYLLRRISSR